MLELTPPAYREHIANKLAQLPDSPGVYLHKSASGQILYVGKAVNLKNRVKNYFQSPKNHSAKVIALVRNIVDFDFILTASETEALTLESNLIKAHRPRYNVLLKDDKNFPYVRIDVHSPYPKAQIVHAIKHGDKAKYFGPYLSKYAVRDAIDSVKMVFPLRSCSKDIEKAIAKGERPCLNYHIGRCLGPCACKVSKEAYREVVEQVMQFLSGNTAAIEDTLKREMLREAEAMNYERAGMLRDRLHVIDVINQRQKAIVASDDERDVFAYHCNEQAQALVYALVMRDGKVVDANGYELVTQGETPGEIMNSFLMQYYAQSAYIPKQILVSDMPDEVQSLLTWLSQNKKSKVEILLPQRGDKKKLLEMAHTNAVDKLERNTKLQFTKQERTQGALQKLAEAVGLAKPPARMECYDISHLQGVDAVASMVVFLDGEKAVKDYRRFKLKVSSNDDYASMQEVLTRRFTRLIEGRALGKTDSFSCTPDLIVIDGGKGQLNVALGVLEQLKLDIPTIALAEKNEEIFHPAFTDSILLPTGSFELQLMIRLRDEAHRYALDFYRSAHRKEALMSELEGIKGVGAKRRKMLFDAFVSLPAMKGASVEELQAIKGIDTKTAQAIYDHFRENER